MLIGISPTETIDGAPLGEIVMRQATSDRR
jgi:hypothetical protein